MSSIWLKRKFAQVCLISNEFSLGAPNQDKTDKEAHHTCICLTLKTTITSIKICATCLYHILLTWFRTTPRRILFTTVTKIGAAMKIAFKDHRLPKKMILFNKCNLRYLILVDSWNNNSKTWIIIHFLWRRLFKSHENLQIIHIKVLTRINLRLLLILVIRMKTL